MVIEVSGKGKEVTHTPATKYKQIVVSKTPILQNLPAAVKNKKIVEIGGNN